MPDLDQCLRILDAESRYYHENARHYRTSLTGLTTLGLGSLVALLALLKTDRIAVPGDLQTLIPSYTAILLISYGLYLLYHWYNVKLLNELMDENDAMLSDKEILAAARITGDPFNVIFNLSILIAIIAALFTINTISSKNPSFWWMLAMTWVVLSLPIVWRVYRSRKNRQYVIWESLKLVSKGSIFYPYALGLIATGMFFYVSIPMSGGVDGLIVSLYLVEMQIVLVQGLAFYKAQAGNNIIASRLDRLRYRLIHGEAKPDNFLALHESIFKKPAPKIASNSGGTAQQAFREHE